MTASRAARERELAFEAGDLASVKVEVNAAAGRLIYKITCLACRPQIWGTYQRGNPNGRGDALTRWRAHLAHKHPAHESPDQ